MVAITSQFGYREEVPAALLKSWINWSISSGKFRQVVARDGQLGPIKEVLSRGCIILTQWPPLEDLWIAIKKNPREGRLEQAMNLTDE